VSVLGCPLVGPPAPDSLKLLSARKQRKGVCLKFHANKIARAATSSFGNVGDTYMHHDNGNGSKRPHDREIRTTFC